MPAKIDKICSETDKHQGDITCVAYNSDYVFTGGADGTIKVWDKDLNLIKTLDHHFGSYIYAIAVSYKGKLYSTSCDGLVKCMKDPLDGSIGENLMQANDDIQCLYCDGDRFFTADSVGNVCQWQNENILATFNFIEEIKSLVVEGNLIYTVQRDLDVLITEVLIGSKHGRYTAKCTLAGKSPLALCGPKIDGKCEFLVFCTRSGRGLNLCDNKKGNAFRTIWIKEDCHEMIINSICGTDKTLFTAGYDKIVKMWTNFDKECKLAAEINLGSCINWICIGENEYTIYSATSDGFLRKIIFT